MTNDSSEQNTNTSKHMRDAEDVNKAGTEKDTEEEGEDNRSIKVPEERSIGLDRRPVSPKEGKPKGKKKENPESGGPTTSVRLGEEEKEIILKRLELSPYESVSEYVRHVVSGWDRDEDAVVRLALLVRWAKSNQREVIGNSEWTDLMGLLESAPGSVTTHPISDYGDPKQKLDRILEAVEKELHVGGAATLERETGLKVEGERQREADSDATTPAKEGGLDSHALNKRLRWKTVALKRKMLTENESTKPTGATPTTSVKLAEGEKAVILQNVKFSPYDTVSEYVRQVATGWDPNGSVIGRLSVLVRWVRSNLQTGIDKEDWAEIEHLLQDVLGGAEAHPMLGPEHKVGDLEEVFETIDDDLLLGPGQMLEDVLNPGEPNSTKG